MALLVLLVVLAFLVGGVGLLVKGLLWLVIIAAILLVVAMLIGTRVRR